MRRLALGGIGRAAWHGARARGPGRAGHGAATRLAGRPRRGLCTLAGPQSWGTVHTDPILTRFLDSVLFLSQFMDTVHRKKIFEKKNLKLK